MNEENPSEEELCDEPVVVQEVEYKTNWGEEKDRCKMDLIKDKLDDDWFKGTEFDDDDIDGIMDYLELQGHDGFTDPDDEAYEQRRCNLLGISYKALPQS